MKFKQKLAILLAGTMVMATPCVAFASETEITGPGIGGSVDGSGTTGSIVNRDVFKATVPTTIDLGFKLDPQGLVDLATGSSATVDDLSGSAGKIIFANDNSIIVRNKGTVPLAVTTTVKITDGVTGQAAGTPNGVVLVDSANDVNTGSALNMHFTMTPAATINASGDAITGLASSYAVGASGLTKAFKVNTTEYTYYKDAADNVTYIPVAGATIDAIGFELAGTINKDADWSSFAGATPANTIGLQVIYGIEQLAGAYNDAVTDPVNTAAHGLLKDVPAGGGSGSGAVTSFTFTRGSTTVDPTFDVALPAGASASTAPTISIVGTKSGNTTPKTPLAGGGQWTYNASTGKLVFPKTGTGLASSWITDTYTCTLTFSNNTTATVTLIVR